MLDHLDRPAPEDRMALQDNQDSLVLLALMDNQGMLDLEEMLVLGVRLDLVVTQAVPVQVASQDCEEMLVRLGLQGPKVALVQGVILAQRDLQETSVRKDSQDQPGPAGSLDLRVSEEIRVRKDPLERQVNRVRLDRRARKVSKAHRDRQDQLDLSVHRVCAAILGQQDRLDKEV